MVKRIIQISGLRPIPLKRRCAFHQACNWVAQRAFERKLANRYALHKRYYYQVRLQFDLPAQMACLTFAQVAAAYQRDKSKQVSFRPLASIPYDARLLHYRGLDRVSLTTLDGRIVVPMVMGAYQAEQFGHVKRYAELVRRRDGKWFLMATVEFDDAAGRSQCGVDLGNLATDSDGQQHSGADVERVRRKWTLRQKLQSAADQAQNHRRRKRIRKKLHRRALKEANFRRNTNHVLSKRIVEQAKGTIRGIALETSRASEIASGFASLNAPAWRDGLQLRRFIAYKAQAAGVRVKVVDPKHTSQMCSQRTCRAGESPPSRFCCRRCGHQAHADVNAARNIRARALCQRAYSFGLAAAAG